MSNLRSRHTHRQVFDRSGRRPLTWISLARPMVNALTTRRRRPSILCQLLCNFCKF
ncbi:hypothetical protein KL86PLE_41110 [uncultured Pleomorphomonas sp.]|uniref:Uncharacterized protein n=1 Tax=uncultured Pleomorphomonas sp. TaxID=442121 RepID=A0A212LIC2_9HYPH|nr:hypothetical protein KL86PLE_41110 [uncultured Pleomorphomonas sp.]